MKEEFFEAMIDELNESGNDIRIGVVISSLMRKFFCGRIRGTVVRSVGNLLKVVKYLHNGHCLVGLFLGTC